MDGAGTDGGPAEMVAAEIEAAGGEAIADTSDVSSVDSANALIDTAVSHFGGIDIVINNAGIMRWAGPPQVDAASITDHFNVHTLGSFNTVRAAWPHMVEAGYGRIVMTTSAGMLGHPANTAYATAKGGVVGLTRSLHTAGNKHGIKINLIAPAAITRMAGVSDGDAPTEEMSPDLAAPMAAFLSHEDCPVSGEIYGAGAGRFNRMFIASTPGYLHADGEPGIEDVATNWAAINDESGYSVPTDLMDWSAAFTNHLPDQ
jgi:NAD(P)-dependent dehydrogenase (short-subunit alcohol dehydrogenase family)